MKRILSIALCVLIFITCTAFAESSDSSMTRKEGEAAVADLVTIWEENGIYITLPKPSAAALEGRLLYRISNGSWESTQITLIYDYAKHDEDDNRIFYISLPDDYAPTRDICALSFSYFLQMEVEDCYDLYDNLVYNCINGMTERVVNGYNIVFGITSFSILLEE